jgi:hypothetical protein
VWTRARSGLAVKARRWRSRHGIAARHVAIHSRVPWYLKVLALAGVVALALVIGRGLYEAGRGWVGLDATPLRAELAGLRERLAVVESELAGAQQQVDSAHSTLQIERAAQEQLTARIRSLESENSRLREDMLVFESLAGASGTGQGFKINRLVLEPDVEAGRFRYRMLIVRQGGKAEQDTRGAYQIVAAIDRQGQGATMTFPPEAGDLSYRVNFRHFQRVDGVLAMPAGATLKSIEVRFLQDGQIKARATAVL